MGRDEIKRRINSASHPTPFVVPHPLPPPPAASCEKVGASPLALEHPQPPQPQRPFLPIYWNAVRRGCLCLGICPSAAAYPSLSPPSSEFFRNSHRHPPTREAVGDHPFRMCCAHVRSPLGQTLEHPVSFPPPPPPPLPLSTFPTNLLQPPSLLSLLSLSLLPPVLGYSLRRKRDLSSTLPPPIWARSFPLRYSHTQSFAQKFGGGRGKEEGGVRGEEQRGIVNSFPPPRLFPFA